nr:hypothetical protein [Tanacetum cinerariifolium]
MKNCATVRGDSVIIIKGRRQNLHRDGVKDPATTSRRGRLKEDLESCTWRWRYDFKATLSHRDANPIRTLGDYSKPSHEGYGMTIELPEWNNVVPLRSDTTWERTRLCLLQFFLRDQASNWLERLLVGSITTWEDLHGRILLLVSLLTSFHRKGLKNSAMTSLYSNNIKKNLFLKHGLISRTYSKKYLIMALIFGSKSKSFMTMSIPLQDEPSINQLWKASQVNKITFSCKICGSPHDTQYYIENPEQAFVEYASSRIDEAGGLVSNFMGSQDARLSKFKVDFKQQQSEMTNKIDTVLKAITDRIAVALPNDTVKTCSKEASHSQTSQPKTGMRIGTSQIKEPEPTFKDELQDLHLNLPVLEVLAHSPIYNAMLDKYMESLELGKNGSAFVQGEVSAKMKGPELFTLPCRLGNSKPFITLADLGSCVNIIPLYLFKKLHIGPLEETNHIFGLADGTKSYPVGIVKDVEVHIGKLKLLNDFYVIDMKKDPETPLLVGRGFLAIANAVIDSRKAKIAVEEGIARSVFEVKEVDLGEEEAPYWTTLGKMKSYKS